MKKRIKDFVDKLPYIRTLKKDIQFLSQELSIYKTDHPPGHFYSPIVAAEKIEKNAGEIFSIKADKIPGVNLNEYEQIELLNKLKEQYADIPFGEEKSPEFRYYFRNTYYCFSDAIFLNLIMRHFKPKSIIEIGSGFSSAVMLDTNEYFLDNKVKFTFVDPYPERLFSLFKEADKNHNVIIRDLENVELAIFDYLTENDILFVDSTHVSKTGSDVNKIIFEILPRLKKGVLIHFHDIFYPFEYPREWVLNWKGFGWNEDYILKAFLMYNSEFKIIMFNTFLEHFHKDWFKENMPDCLKNEGGSLWLQKL